ncbi:MAG: thioredoxin family protein [Deltaproteobacteria bacterium]|nr:thioredoxin family protein [Deltaproteobacteria bacterium]
MLGGWEAQEGKRRKSWLGIATVTLALCWSGWSHAADLLGEQARQAKKPFVVDFGMNRCGQCIEQGKVMDRLKITLGDRLLTRFVHIGKEEVLAEAYKVLLIPTIVIFDAQGREVFRNVGLMRYEIIEEKLKELQLL